MSILKKHKVGTLKDAYNALLDECIICNPKYSPCKDPKYKYCKIQLDKSDNSIVAYGVGKVMMLDHFMTDYEEWPDGWELYYPEMHNDKLIDIDGEVYRLSEVQIKTLKEYVNNICKLL